MVIVILLTMLDLLAALVLVLHMGFGLFSPEAILYNAAYLIVKGLLFAKDDFPSRIDIIAGLYMVSIGFDFFSNQFLSMVVVVWLAQKGVFIIFNVISKIFFR